MAATCTICNKPVTLVPSAAERAKKYGDHPAAYYTRLFPDHTSCVLAKRKADDAAFYARLRKEEEARHKACVIRTYKVKIND